MGRSGSILNWENQSLEILFCFYMTLTWLQLWYISPFSTQGLRSSAHLYNTIPWLELSTLFDTSPTGPYLAVLCIFKNNCNSHINMPFLSATLNSVALSLETRMALALHEERNQVLLPGEIPDVRLESGATAHSERAKCWELCLFRERERLKLESH